MVYMLRLGWCVTRLSLLLAFYAVGVIGRHTFLGEVLAVVLRYLCSVLGLWLGLGWVACVRAWSSDRSGFCFLGLAIHLAAHNIRNGWCFSLGTVG